MSFWPKTLLFIPGFISRHRNRSGMVLFYIWLVNAMWVFDCGKHGHIVRLFDFDTFPDNIKAIQQQGGIRAEGKLEGFAPIEYAGHEIEVALSNVKIIYAVGPAYSTRPFAEACRPYLRKGQIVIICPGSSMGSIEFKNQAQLSLKDETIIVAV